MWATSAPGHGGHPEEGSVLLGDERKDDARRREALDELASEGQILVLGD